MATAYPKFDRFCEFLTKAREVHMSSFNARGDAILNAMLKPLFAGVSKMEGDELDEMIRHWHGLSDLTKELQEQARRDDDEPYQRDCREADRRLGSPSWPEASPDAPHDDPITRCYALRAGMLDAA
jgi:hypothetical protein